MSTSIVTYDHPMLSPLLDVRIGRGRQRAPSCVRHPLLLLFAFLTAQPPPKTGCHVYTSEGRDAKVIAHLRDVCRAQPGVLLASAFVDEPYHRSSVTLVSRSADAVSWEELVCVCVIG